MGVGGERGEAILKPAKKILMERLIEEVRLDIASEELNSLS